jgi:hypothetical protein
MHRIRSSEILVVVFAVAFFQGCGSCAGESVPDEKLTVRESGDGATGDGGALGLGMRTTLRSDTAIRVPRAAPQNDP